jgi:hypothetical protein
MRFHIDQLISMLQCSKQNEYVGIRRSMVEYGGVQRNTAEYGEAKAILVDVDK